MSRPGTQRAAQADAAWEISLILNKARFASGVFGPSKSPHVSDEDRSRTKRVPSGTDLEHQEIIMIQNIDLNLRVHSILFPER